MSADSILASLIDTPASEKDAKALEFIEEITKNANAVQKIVLAEILTQNGETEYLKSFNLDGATDPATFKSKIPMITYEDFKPWIQRIANGDRSSILSAKPINELVLSSGTSAGEPKLIPFIEGDWERRMLGHVALLRPVMNQYVKGLDEGKALHFRFIRAESKTRGGLVAQPVSTSFYKNMRMKNYDYDQKTILHEAVTCGDFFQSMYAQILWGLYERKQIVRIGAPFASGLVGAITFLQLNWQQLTHDIRAGSLNPNVTDKSIREAMIRIMLPDPELADLVARECAKDNWEGIITRIWPDTKYLDAIVTGSMAQYISILDHYSGGLPIVCTRYASSECFIGINLNPMCKPSQVSYTIMPNMAYFEFLPHEPHSPGLTRPTLVDLADVEIGKEYELVVTTYAGLYRYRVGDILRVTGFHNSAPQFRFVGRKNFVLCVDMEKTDETDLQVAVENASQLLREFNTRVVEYTSYADTTTTPGHYVIYLELLTRDSADSPSDQVLEQCCLAMEESLNAVYRRLRGTEKSIGPLEIRVVKIGTFEELMKSAISRGASISQYKVPRSISTEPILNLVDSRVIAKHFSPSTPHWFPEQRV